MPEIYLVKTGNWYVTSAEINNRSKMYKIFGGMEKNEEVKLEAQDLDRVAVGPLEDADFFTDERVAHAASQVIGGIVLKADHWEPVKADE